MFTHFTMAIPQAFGDLTKLATPSRASTYGLQSRDTLSVGDFYTLDIERGVFSVLCIFTAIFFVLLGFCGFIFSRSIGRQRYPYMILLLAIFFQLICLIFATADQGLPLFDSTKVINRDLKMALINIPNFFSWWSLAALFWSVVMFLQARERDQQLWPISRRSRLIIGMHLFLLALVVILGTAAFGLYADYEKNLLFLTFDTINDLNSKYNRIQTVLHIADAFLYVTAPDIAITSAVLYRCLRLKELQDPIVKYILQIVTPLYCLHIACLLTFTIVSSSPVSNDILESGGIRRMAIVGLISDILTYTFLTLVISSLLFMSREGWSTAKTDESIDMYDARHDYKDIDNVGDDQGLSHPTAPTTPQQSWSYYLMAIITALLPK